MGFVRLLDHVAGSRNGFSPSTKGRWSDQLQVKGQRSKLKAQSSNEPFLSPFTFHLSSNMGMQPGTLQRPVSSKPGVNPDQARLAEVIPRARIPPVLGDVHISPLHQVPVNIVQLFPHHILAENHLRMGAFLPKLVFPVVLVRLLDHVAGSRNGFSPSTKGRWSVRGCVPTLERGNDQFFTTEAQRTQRQ